MSKRITLIFPPLVYGNYFNIYPSLPFLTGALDKQGYEVDQLELNNEFIDWYLNSKCFTKNTKRYANKVIKYERQDKLDVEQYDDYIKCKKKLALIDILSRNYDERCLYIGDVLADMLPHTYIEKDIASGLKNRKLANRY